MSNVYVNQASFQADNQRLGVGLRYSENTGVLSKELRIQGKIVPNRLVCQAMEGCDGTVTGEPDVLTRRRYERLAKGGAGMVWFEATAVLPEGRANPRQLHIHDGNIDAFRRQVEAIKSTCLQENGYEPLVLMQATHSGRYAKPHGTPAPLIAYNNPIFEKDTPIAAERIVTDDELDRIGEALVHGAQLAERAGFDGVDIKCCHRYLNCELLSAFEREGRYGGSLENRTRLVRDAIRGALAVCSSDFIVSSRLNVYDGFPYPYGFGVKRDGSLAFDATEPIWLIQELKRYGVQLLNITMGNPYVNPHVNRPYAHGGYESPEHPLTGVARMLNGTAEIKAQVGDITLICSALSFLGVAAPHVAAAYIEHGDFELAGFGRTIFAYPDFAKDILTVGEMDAKRCCICCSKCTEIMRKSGGTPGCVIRDKDVYLPIYKKLCGGGAV